MNTSILPTTRVLNSISTREPLNTILPAMLNSRVKQEGKHSFILMGGTD